LASLEERAQASDAALHQGVHELRNSLSVILLVVTRLLATREAAGDRRLHSRKNLTRVEASARHMTDLIDGLPVARNALTDSRLQRAGAISGLAPMLSAAAKSLEPLAQAQEVKLKVEVPRLPPTSADAGALGPVLEALLQRALESAGQGGEVLLTAEADAE